MDSKILTEKNVLLGEEKNFITISAISNLDSFLEGMQIFGFHYNNLNFSHFLKYFHEMLTNFMVFCEKDKSISYIMNPNEQGLVVVKVAVVK